MNSLKAQNKSLAIEDEQFRNEYMRCNIHDFGIMEEGKEFGRSEANLEAARKMLLTNLGTIEQIADVQGLPLETVKQLSNELQENFFSHSFFYE